MLNVRDIKQDILMAKKCRPPFIVPLPGHPDAMHDATRDARARKASY